MKKGAIVLGGLAAGGLLVFALTRKAKAAISPLADPELTPLQALAKSRSYLNAIVQKYSDDTTLTDHVEQALNTISLNVAQGISPADDYGAAVFNGQIEAYKIYRAENGTKSFADFTLHTDIKQVSPVAAAAIKAAKDVYFKAQADSIIASYTAPENLAYYVNLLDPRNELRIELETRPEVQAVMAPPPAPAPAPAPAPPPPPPPAPVIYEDFTGSASQLVSLVASGVSADSGTYQAAAVTAYSQAAEVAAQTGGVVSWSSEGGYEAVSVEDSGWGYDYYW